MTTLREEMASFGKKLDEVYSMVPKVNKLCCVLTGDCEDGFKSDESVLWKVALCYEFYKMWKKFWWAFILSLLTIPSGVAIVGICIFFHLTPK